MYAFRWAVAAAVLGYMPLLAHARDRTYYVQAEELDWDYIPTDWNLVQCLPLENDVMATPFISVSARTFGDVLLLISTFLAGHRWN